MGTQFIVYGFIICHDRNINLIILNTSLPKTNIYPEGVAMFSLRFCHKISSIAKTKIKNKIKYKHSTKAQNEIQSEIFSGLG